MSAVTAAALDVARLEPSRASRLLTGAGALAAGGVVLAVAAAIEDADRFLPAYLTGYLWTLSISLGCLFFVLVQHLTRAGWSVAARRQAEWFTGALPFAAILFLPIVWRTAHLFEWMGPDAAHDPILHGKAAYLNPTFFYVRALIYFAVWALLALGFTRLSRRQDETGDPALTVRMQVLSAPATLAFGVTISFAAFDWIMSLQPHWYSTIFGVYFFSGSAVAAFAVLALTTTGMQKAGLLARVSSVEHRHDLGKLLFGFTVFWAYIAFSQFMLIWYANMPEETVFFLKRWTGSWKPVSLSLLFLHFLLPFALLLSRTGKRVPAILVGTSILLLAMHYVDLYWQVMPVFSPSGARFGWVEFAGLLAPAGLLGLWVALRMGRDPLYPLRDPRLGEAMQVENP